MINLPTTTWSRSHFILVCFVFRSSFTSPSATRLIPSTRAARSRPGCSGHWLATPSLSSSCSPISTTKPIAANLVSNRLSRQSTASPRQATGPAKHLGWQKTERNPRTEEQRANKRKDGYGRKHYRWFLAKSDFVYWIVWACQQWDISN